MLRQALYKILVDGENEVPLSTGRFTFVLRRESGHSFALCARANFDEKCFAMFTRNITMDDKVVSSHVVYHHFSQTTPERVLEVFRLYQLRTMAFLEQEIEVTEYVKFPTEMEKAQHPFIINGVR